MGEALLKSDFIAAMPDIEQLVTEDDEPVDNIFSAKQQRLLVEPLYTSWKSEQPFLADANVGIFNSVYQPPIVPDMWLSLDVQADPEIWKKENRSYFMWKFGKPPEIAIEIISNNKGGENDKKFRKYAQIGLSYYVVFDPQLLVQEKILKTYVLSVRRYVTLRKPHFPQIGLGLTLWQGTYENITAQWLRWCDFDGNLLLTGAEYVLQEQQRAEQERQRADKLVAQLLAMGVKPTL